MLSILLLLNYVLLFLLVLLLASVWGSFAFQISRTVVELNFTTVYVQLWSTQAHVRGPVSCSELPVGCVQQGVLESGTGLEGIL